jgi:hypothetical protein
MISIQGYNLLAVLSHGRGANGIKERAVGEEEKYDCVQLMHF